jgi:hypothetical protein
VTGDNRRTLDRQKTNWLLKKPLRGDDSNVVRIAVTRCCENVSATAPRSDFIGVPLVRAARSTVERTGAPVKGL